MSSTVIDVALRLLALWSLAATIALLMIAVLRPLVRRQAGSRAALRLWWILPVVLLIPALPKEVHVAVPLVTESFQILDPGIAPELAKAEPVAANAPSEMPSAAQAPTLMFTPAGLLLAWAVGALVLFAWLGAAQWRYERRITWHGRRGVLPSQHMPAVVGLLSPRLVLPEDFAKRFSHEEQRLIRMHEAVHQLRRDGIAHLFMNMLRVLLWFHPLVHWAARALGDDQESACDEVVVSRHPQQLRAYAALLIRSVDGAPELRAPLVSQWLAFHPVVKRVAMLKQYRQPKTKRIFASLVLVSGGLASAAMVYALQPEKVVRVVVPVPGESLPKLEAAASESRSGPRWAGMLEPMILNTKAAATDPPSATSLPVDAPSAERQMGRTATSVESTALPNTSPTAQPAPPPAPDGVPRVTLVSDPSDAPASADASRMNYLTLEVLRNDQLIASPALVAVDGRAAAIKVDGGVDEPVSLRVIPTRGADGKISLKLEFPASYPASNQVSIKSAALLMSPKDARRVQDDHGIRTLNLVVLPGERAVVRFGTEPQVEEWRLRVFPVPRFAATNGGTGSEINAITAFACPGTGQTLLPRVMRLLAEDVQVSSIYRDADSGMLKLVGVAQSNKRLSELVKGLSADSAFLHVNLLSANRQEPAGSQFQIELGLNCALPAQATGAPAPSGSPARTRSANIGLNMQDVKFGVLVGVLGDYMGRKLRGTEALPAELVRLKAMPVDVAQATHALLACAGFQMVEEAGQWWVRRDESRAAETDLNACAARSVTQGPAAPTQTARTWPSSLNGSFRVAIRVDIGNGLYSQYEKSAVVGEVMRLPLSPDAALVCTLMSIAERLHLRCTENQDGLPLPTKHVVMKRIDSETPLHFAVQTSRGNLAAEVTINERLGAVKSAG